MTTTDRVRQFITDNFYLPDPALLSNDSSLVREGVVDSTGVLEIVAFIEQELGVAVDDGDMLPENLDSIDAIVAFVERRKVAA